MTYGSSFSISLVSLFVFLAGSLCAQRSWAQSQCSRGVDAFQATRRARQALEDFEQINQSISSDLQLLSTGDEEYRLKHPLNLRVYGAASGEVFGFPALGVCNSDGQSTSGSLLNSRLGLIAGIDELTNGLSIRYVYSLYFSQLNASITVPPSIVVPSSSKEKFDANYGADTGQTTHAVRIQPSRWFALTLGTILYEPVELNETSNGVGLEGDINASDGSNHIFLRAEIPQVNTSLDLVLGDDRQSIETLYVNLNQVRLGALPVEVNARAAYLNDEERFYTLVGGNWLIEEVGEEDVIEVPTANGDIERLYQRATATYRLGADITPEFNSLNLRYAQARASARYLQYSSYLENEVSKIVMGSSYFDAQASMFLSVYRGQFMEELTGETTALGFGAQGSVGLGFRAMSIYVDSFLGVNRPETLTYLAQAVDTLEMSIQLRWRVGF